MHDFGEHIIHSKELFGFKYKYAFVRDSFLIYLRTPVKNEVPMNFLSDPQNERLTLLSIDVMMYDW